MTAYRARTWIAGIALLWVLATVFATAALVGVSWAKSCRPSAPVTVVMGVRG